jgi:hypothetical protein
MSAGRDAFAGLLEARGTWEPTPAPSGVGRRSSAKIVAGVRNTGWGNEPRPRTSCTFSNVPLLTHAPIGV